MTQMESPKCSYWWDTISEPMPSLKKGGMDRLQKWVHPRGFHVSKKIWGKKLKFQSLLSNQKPAEMSLQEVLTASAAAEMEMMLQMVLLEQEMLLLRPLPSTTQNPLR